MGDDPLPKITLCHLKTNVPRVVKTLLQIKKRHVIFFAQNIAVLLLKLLLNLKKAVYGIPLNYS